MANRSLGGDFQGSRVASNCGQLLALLGILFVAGCGGGRHNEWTWMRGSNLTRQKGTYGTQRTRATGNVPGARNDATAWTDAAGNFWLFGGWGYDSTGSGGLLNDLWEYSEGQWTCMNGSNHANQQGSYGTQGITATGNTPGARRNAMHWTDVAGNFWLLGGNGYDSTGTPGLLSDLWEYSEGQWTWIRGSRFANQQGTYGTQGTTAAGNVPGARSDASTWTDATGNFWLFGGTGYDSTGTPGLLNDLWEYSEGEWTWIRGSRFANQQGAYGTQGTASVGNNPGARANATSWTDAAGNLWLFGGWGYGSTDGEGLEWLNDLWKFSAGQWTWVGGSNLVHQKGTYGAQGTPTPGNIPGARDSAIHWTDASGNLWLFGGDGYDSAGTRGLLNDLWKYSGGQWTWVGGSNLVYQKGTYGSQGRPTPGNIPGARMRGVGWTDAAGNLWLFGGGGTDSTGARDVLNDLWKYEP